MPVAVNVIVVVRIVVVLKLFQRAVVSVMTVGMPVTKGTGTDVVKT